MGVLILGIYNKESLIRVYYRFSPGIFIGEILTKRWMEAVITFCVLSVVAIGIGSNIVNYFNVASLVTTFRQFGEYGFLFIGMAIVMMAGGIDLSVGSIFALSNITTLIFLNVLGYPLYLAVFIALLVGVVAGLINGLLVGILRLRAFLTTLVTLVIFRAIYDMLALNFASDIASVFIDTAAWEFMGEGLVFGFPINITILVIIAIIMHIMVSRSRPGWHIMAIGSSRRAAYSAGIPIKSTILLTYVFSGLMCAVAGCFYAARLNNTGGDVGRGIELITLTGVVLGGVSLGGGRGSITRALMGGLTVFIMTNGLVRLGVSGGANSMTVGMMLAMAVWFDVKYQKNRHKIIDKVYVSPTYLFLPEAPDTHIGCKNAYEQNDLLRESEPIGLEQVEGPEDVILDRYNNLYCGTRTGDILRFSGTRFERREVFAHIGGRPLGLAFDRDDNLITCVSGMGLYGVTPEGKIFKLTDQTNRSWDSVIDDSRLSLADDLDIASNGQIFFSEATIRYDIHSWPTDSLEGRGNGRIICFDPANGTTRTVIRNLIFPNGVCMANDNESFFFAETWACRISRYWYSGPNKGKVVRVIDNLPGYPDNINRASDGNYWVALVGMRTPAFDLAMRMPGFRSRMFKRIPSDEWLFTNMNTGCVLKYNEDGEVLSSYWDLGGKYHQTISSMREHRGYLYIGGVNNNRIGRVKIDGVADREWIAQDTYWRSKK
jgi:ribose transport system permease protein